MLIFSGSAEKTPLFLPLFSCFGGENAAFRAGFTRTPPDEKLLARSIRLRIFRLH
jgi:hypothetical protein